MTIGRKPPKPKNLSRPKGVTVPAKSGRLADKAVLKRQIAGELGQAFGFNYVDQVDMCTTTPNDGKPRCARCGYEFKLLTAMGVGPQKDMYCKTCTEVRVKLEKQIKDWKEMDARIKERIMPKVKGYSWLEAMGRTL